MVTSEGPGQYGLGDAGSISVKIGQVLPPVHVIVAHREAPAAPLNA
jgi:hypothetical protein